jgi:FAD/FMN-containing dehydrogenase
MAICIFFVAPGEAGDSAAQHAVCDELVYRPLARLGGAVSAEHGIGLEKKEWFIGIPYTF